MSAVARLAETWRGKANDPLVHTAAAAALRLAATDLEAALAGAVEQPVSLRAAAEATGVRADSLSRMIREGRLANHGRKHAPLVLVSDVPPRAPRALRTTRAARGPDDDVLDFGALQRAAGVRRARR